MDDIFPISSSMDDSAPTYQHDTQLYFQSIFASSSTQNKTWLWN